MKISKAVRDIYKEAKGDAEKLKGHIDGLLRPLCNQNNWLYSSRVKSEVSFALKIETGRFDDPFNLEDMFASMIVVPTINQIKQARDLITAEDFIVKEQRPPDTDITKKSPESFIFDDLRLYVVYRQPNNLPEKAFLNRVFEIQVKTFLQHAWSITTHDLVYKGERFDWARSRLASQMKAMLEHTESTIASVDKIADLLSSPKYEKFEGLNQLISVYKEYWNNDLLPDDLKRLGETTHKLTQKLGLSVEQVIEALEDAKNVGLGGEALDLSPYQSMIISIYRKYPDIFSSKLKDFKLPLTDEMINVYPEINSLKKNEIKLSRNEN